MLAIIRFVYYYLYYVTYAVRRGRLPVIEKFTAVSPFRDSEISEIFQALVEGWERTVQWLLF
jgi:hypothetical protein